MLGRETTHPFHGGHRRHDQDGHRRVGLGSTPSLEGDGVTGGWCRNPSVSRPGKMETFGQIACSVRRLPIHFMVGTGGTIRMVETFGQVACSVRRPARSYLFRYGHSRTIRSVTGGIGLGSTPSLEGDGVTGGWCRYPSVSRPGKMETFGQVGCTTGADGDLRSGRVLGEDAGTIRMRAQVARSG